jgi:hypothetical protein
LVGLVGLSFIRWHLDHLDLRLSFWFIKLIECFIISLSWGSFLLLKHSIDSAGLGFASMNQEVVTKSCCFRNENRFIVV